MAARAHNVFWLVEILKILLLETTKPIELWLTQWSFLQSHNSIGLVVSKKIFKIPANENTSWTLAAMLDFKSAPKTQIW
jgi:hypothetical protein